MSTEISAPQTKFEQLYFSEEDKAAEKQEQFALDFVEKKHHMNTRIGNLTVEIVKLEREFKASITTPGKDPIKIKCQLLAAQEELLIANDIFKEFFQ